MFVFIKGKAQSQMAQGIDLTHVPIIQFESVNWKIKVDILSKVNTRYLSNIFW